MRVPLASSLLAMDVRSKEQVGILQMPASPLKLTAVVLSKAVKPVHVC